MRKQEPQNKLRRLRPQEAEEQAYTQVSPSVKLQRKLDTVFWEKIIGITCCWCAAVERKECNQWMEEANIIKLALMLAKEKNRSELTNQWSRSCGIKRQMIPNVLELWRTSYLSALCFNITHSNTERRWSSCPLYLWHTFGTSDI